MATRVDLAGRFKATRVRLFANGFAAFCFAATFLSFVTPYWLTSDRRYYGAIFVRLGLWETCFRSMHDPDDLIMSKYYAGCRWILTDEYQKLRSFIEKSFFIAVQVFFTIGFTALLVSCILILAVHLCLSPKKDAMMVRVIGGLTFLAAICCTIAVVVFGIHGDGRDWMPDPDHNYLSWSFALGVVGAFFSYIAAALFFIEASKAKKREDAINHHVAYHMEQTHTKV